MEEPARNPSFDFQRKFASFNDRIIKLESQRKEDSGKLEELTKENEGKQIRQRDMDVLHKQCKKMEEQIQKLSQAIGTYIGKNGRTGCASNGNATTINARSISMTPSKSSGGVNQPGDKNNFEKTGNSLGREEQRNQEEESSRVNQKCVDEDVHFLRDSYFKQHEMEIATLRERTRLGQEDILEMRKITNDLQSDVANLKMQNESNVEKVKKEDILEMRKITNDLQSDVANLKMQNESNVEKVKKEDISQLRLSISSLTTDVDSLNDSRTNVEKRLGWMRQLEKEALDLATENKNTLTKMQTDLEDEIATANVILSGELDSKLQSIMETKKSQETAMRKIESDLADVNTKLEFQDVSSQAIRKELNDKVVLIEESISRDRIALNKCLVEIENCYKKTNAVGGDACKKFHSNCSVGNSVDQRTNDKGDLEQEQSVVKETQTQSKEHVLHTLPSSNTGDDCEVEPQNMKNVSGFISKPETEKEGDAPVITEPNTEDKNGSDTANNHKATVSRKRKRECRKAGQQASIKRIGSSKLDEYSSVPESKSNTNPFQINSDLTVNPWTRASSGDFSNNDQQETNENSIVTKSQPVNANRRNMLLISSNYKKSLEVENAPLGVLPGTSSHKQRKRESETKLSKEDKKVRSHNNKNVSKDGDWKGVILWIPQDDQVESASEETFEWLRWDNQGKLWSYRFRIYFAVYKNEYEKSSDEDWISVKMTSLTEIKDSVRLTVHAEFLDDNAVYISEAIDECVIEFNSTNSQTQDIKKQLIKLRETKGRRHTDENSASVNSTCSKRGSPARRQLCISVKATFCTEKSR